MDDVDDLFSAEALRLLEQSAIDYETVSGEVPVDHEPRTALPQCETRVKQINSYPFQRVPGCSTLPLGKTVKAKRKRKQFDSKLREKVATVRKKGACLRCRILKVPCSGSWPCSTCTRNKISCNSREPKHKWMGCVPYCPGDVDIYSLDFPCSQEQYNAILQVNNNILFDDAKHTFGSEVNWDLESIVSNCAEWILHERVDPGMNSRVWIFSSLKAELLLSTFVHNNLSKALRVLVKTSSILHNWGMDAECSHYTSSDLWRIRSFAGSQVVRGLKTALKNTSLAKASIDVLKALFLVLLGTIIAVGYSTPVSHSDEQLETPIMTPNAFEEAQKELLRILTYHMILIAERVRIIDSQEANCSILENAYRLWSGKAVFEWEVARLDGLGKLAVYACCTNCGAIAQPFETATASSFNTLSDTSILLDSSYEPPIARTNDTYDNSVLGRCFFCANALDADGLCQPCLPLHLDVASNENLDYLGDPLQGQMVSEIQTSDVMRSLPCFEDQKSWSDFPELGIEKMGEMSTPSLGPGQHQLSTTYSNLPSHLTTSDVSTLGVSGIASASAPLTHDSPEFTSPMNAFEYLSSGNEILTSNDCYGGGINSSKGRPRGRPRKGNSSMSASTPLTHDSPEFTSPMNAFEDPSPGNEILTSNDCYGARTNLSKGRPRGRPRKANSSVSARRQNRLRDKKERRPQTLTHNNYADDRYLFCFSCNVGPLPVKSFMTGPFKCGGCLGLTDLEAWEKHYEIQCSPRIHNGEYTECLSSHKRYRGDEYVKRQKCRKLLV